MQYYFIVPFADAGDKAAIPVTVQPDGTISFPDGYGVDYQLDPSTPPGLNIERTKFNQLMYAATLSIKQYQESGFPDFITSSDNGGSPFAYSINATVRFTGGWGGAGALNYYSLADSNTADPTDATKWGLVQYSTQPFVTGDLLMWGFSTIRTGGWVWLNGTTLGDASSGATGRANADTSTLFAMLWADYSNTVLPIQDSSGSASTRGVSAAADFSAHKRLPTPDYRGRSFFGIDNMGGASAAGRITNAESGISGTTLGANGGTQSVALTSNQNGMHTHTFTTNTAGDHTHTLNDPGHAHTPPDTGTGAQFMTTHVSSTSRDFITGSPGTSNSFATATATATTGISINNAGTHSHTGATDSSGISSTHQNIPPAMIGGGFIMKL